MKDQAGLDERARELPAVMPGHWDTAEGREMALRSLGETREDLCHGEVSDLALANRVFMASRNDLDLIAWQTAAKERIRWLSAHLAAALSGQQPADVAGMVEKLRAALAAKIEEIYLAQLEPGVGEVALWEMLRRLPHDVAEAVARGGGSQGEGTSSSEVDKYLNRSLQSGVPLPPFVAALTTPPPVPDRQDVEASAAFDMGFEWAMSLRGQTLEDSRAVGRTLQSDLFEPIAEEIDRLLREEGFDSFASSDHGICAAKAIIRRALQTRPGYQEGVRAAAAVAANFHENSEPCTDPPSAVHVAIVNVSGHIRDRILALLPPPLTEDQSHEG